MNRYRKKVSTHIFNYVNVLNNEYRLFFVIKGKCSLNMCLFPCQSYNYIFIVRNKTLK